MTLKYSRKDFISDFNSAINKSSSIENEKLFQKLELIPKFNEAGEFVSYEGFPNVKSLDSKKPLHRKISNLIERFTEKNEVVTKDFQLNQVMNSVIKAFPEFTHFIGKAQHSIEGPITKIVSENTSVDVHTMKVYQNMLNNPEYQKLSDSGKIISTFLALFHDSGKIENVLDKGHPATSALYVSKSLENVNLSSNIKNRIVSLTKDHHWLELYNTNKASAEEIALKFKNPEDFKIAKIFADADLKGLNAEFYDAYKSALSKEKLEPVEKAIFKLNNGDSLILSGQMGKS